MGESGYGRMSAFIRASSVSGPSHSCFFSPSFSAVVPGVFVRSFCLWWSLEEVDSLKEVLLSNRVSSSKWYFCQSRLAFIPP
ncbi:hypothetical protein DEO72_LG10g523 [Vigna unguiculata]|uniref:Uncharacterized protein n=1 Tax=Vigna unguiculata TaxID=3917 RepID=A0A4D6N934_VIGUN|nr:hypothetical protein DEO72_LG10g523 [Vigna unguiculata]